MKQYFRKTTSVTLAFLLLFSTLSFAVEKHFCGDSLIDVSFVGKADLCDVEMQSDVVQIKECCKDEVQNIHGQDELQLQNLEKITFTKQQFLSAFVYSFSPTFSITTQKIPFVREFLPPAIFTNFQVKYQTFII